ncbi:peptidoglycan-binding protein [Palleronia sediminis]|uniref:Peptidoglycan-binding protein n=1 Tax=Palleronia sediminis TaxID=2547833 RepID=A0A4R6AL24_9RHOB|nr:holin-associated N-acetylmuramidase [Palleronia sediminis]TDL84125.1 peptidoglycan-binding protein [Palleronia sediminis]
MTSVREIAAEIVAREGGFVNDPDDPGGATKHGVTIGTLRALGLDLDGDGDVDIADIHRIDAARAADIFVHHYFKGPRLDLLPAPLHPTVFDMQVNAGAQAVRLLQALLGRMGFPCAIDGIVGPQTAAAAHKAARAAPAHIVDAYGIERRNFYYRLADARPSLRKFARARDGGKGGWITRAEAFISPAFHLSPAEHRRRVAAWG